MILRKGFPGHPHAGGICTLTFGDEDACRVRMTDHGVGCMTNVSAGIAWVEGRPTSWSAPRTRQV